MYETQDSLEGVIYRSTSFQQSFDIHLFNNHHLLLHSSSSMLLNSQQVSTKITSNSLTVLNHLETTGPKWGKPIMITQNFTQNSCSDVT